MVANSDRILNNGGLLSDARGHPKDDNSLWVLETKRLVHHIEASTIAPPPLQPDQFSEQHRPVEDTNMPRLYDRMASTEAEDPIIPEGNELIRTMTVDFFFAKPDQEKYMTREALLDTQADGNLVFDTLVEQAGASGEMEEYRGRRFQTVRGEVTPIGEVTIVLEWQRAGKLGKKRFLVLEDSGHMPSDLIFGFNFIDECNTYTLQANLSILSLATLSVGKSKVPLTSKPTFLAYHVAKQRKNRLGKTQQRRNISKERRTRDEKEPTTEHESTSRDKKMQQLQRRQEGTASQQQQRPQT